MNCFVCTAINFLALGFYCLRYYFPFHCVNLVNTRTHPGSLELDCFSRRINSRSVGARWARRWLRRRRGDVTGVQVFWTGCVPVGFSSPFLGLALPLRLFTVPKGVRGRWALLRLGSSPRRVSSTRHLRTAHPPSSLSRARKSYSFVRTWRETSGRESRKNCEIINCTGI